MRAQTTQTAATIRSSLHLRFIGIFGTLTLYLVLASNAQAKGAETVGKNLGDLLSTVGGYVLFGVAGLIALGMLAARQFSKIGGLLLMVFVVGGLVFAGDELRSVVQSTWRALAKGA